MRACLPCGALAYMRPSAQRILRTRSRFTDPVAGASPRGREAVGAERGGRGGANRRGRHRKHALPLPLLPRLCRRGGGGRGQRRGGGL
eukprot:1177592-Prorocentrum_minimum.AAC.2